MQINGPYQELRNLLNFVFIIISIRVNYLNLELINILINDLTSNTNDIATNKNKGK
jgi:hypothetical protein